MLQQATAAECGSAGDSQTGGVLVVAVVCVGRIVVVLEEPSSLGCNAPLRVALASLDALCAFSLSRAGTKTQGLSFMSTWRAEDFQHTAAHSRGGRDNGNTAAERLVRRLVELHCRCSDAECALLQASCKHTGVVASCVLARGGTSFMPASCRHTALSSSRRHNV